MKSQMKKKTHSTKIGEHLKLKIGNKDDICGKVGITSNWPCTVKLPCFCTGHFIAT